MTVYEPLPRPKLVACGSRVEGRWKAYYICVRLPWRRQMYSVANDDEGMYRPMWSAIWSRGPNYFKLRCGWIPT